ncbi:aryl hydrocarbon receptor-like isoform X2 [Poecilia reticulata]|uniref:aryl hydrocarbon receptor-like isoform X2 n=1 Tax=Poecilia reticulata TaxID=8081 RepID=UPI0004A29B0A|nr:PREDICTED: aryl hydrocarbon receptor-like isoform X2 [Poecilia reticulata]
MFNNPGTYANKKRKKPVLKQKKVADNNEVVKSNPSKRHRDRLNGELDRLMELLPFPDEVRSRLDKLSVLRLSVGYLRVKSYFKASMKNGSGSRVPLGVNEQNMDSTGFSEGELLLQALNGFVLVVTSEGMVFYASSTIKDYLGFHQSDVVHQSVFELIHTDDRATFREQLHFALNPPPLASDADFSQNCGNAVMYNPEQLPPDNSSFLERSFVCRFRCLLDNSSGFLALKFNGRLKYLQGQNLSRDSESCKSVQVALFAIAVPVQSPSIVEIRAKMLLFLTRHKLDFTPSGVDSRGKIILGYSETELCMKGSGYQFIHAADMMYCADNHIRMIKTGESGLTVFRLLTKSKGWIWVNSNAKLIFKGGRPEFIIAYQKALSNAEGEEYLRQRWLQLPFSCATGEAILYNTGPTMDISQVQFDKMFDSRNTKRIMPPTSLLDCFMSQDESIYSQAVDTPLPVDEVFMDTHALVAVASNEWQEKNSSDMPAEPVLVKEETKQSVLAVIDSLEKLTNSGDFEDILENLEVDDSEMMEMENCFKRFHQEEDPQRSPGLSDLDNFITDEIVDFIDSVFKERAGECLDSLTSSCLTEVKNFSSSELCEPQLFQTPNPSCSYSSVSSCYEHLDDSVVSNQSLVESAPMGSRSHKRSQPGHTDSSLPPLQQLQLHDIFSPAVDLPALTVPNSSVTEAFPSTQPCQKQQASIMPAGCSQGSSVQAQQLLQLGSSMEGPELATGQILHKSAQHPSNTAPGVQTVVPPTIPYSNFTSIRPGGCDPKFLQKGLVCENHSAPVQQWPQSRQQQPHAGIIQNRHEPMSTFQSQHPGSQTFPSSGFCPSSVSRLRHLEQVGPGLAGSQDAHSSCMFQQRFSSNPAGVKLLSHYGPPDLNGANVTLDQSSSYLQWNHSELPVGPSAVNQEMANIAPLAPGTAPAEDSCNIQHYLDSNTQTQNSRVSAQAPGVFINRALME